MARRAGLIAPLFSLASSQGWGIGEFPDLAVFAGWMASGGFRRLMLLPMGMMAPGETSPYAAVSAMAIDPIYVAPHRLEDLPGAAAGRALTAEAADALRAARGANRVRYTDVRLAKRQALEAAYEHFLAEEWAKGSPRADAFAAYVERERDWLDDHALFQAIAARHGGPRWRSWDQALRDRRPDALQAAREALAGDMLRHQFLQWIAESQWQAARAAARADGVELIGDLPFAVGADSADVWVSPHLFRFDVSIGAPPDAFSDTGQDWGLPFYQWDALEASGYDWFRRRARRMAELFDGLRLDHLVGLYRTYGWPAQGDPFFSPADEPAQVRQGEALLRIFLDSGLFVVAEDLGTVPDFVRASMARLGVPGTRVLRWERDWHAPGQPFLDPAAFPPASAAMTGTHDTVTLAAWWDHAPDPERAAALDVPALRPLASAGPDQPWSGRLCDAWIDQLYRAGSDDVFLPLQDLFGWRERINTPGTVGDHNWTWRLPWPVDRLGGVEAATSRIDFCRRLAHETGRSHLR